MRLKWQQKDNYSISSFIQQSAICTYSSKYYLQKFLWVKKKQWKTISTSQDVSEMRDADDKSVMSDKMIMKWL